MRRPPWGGHRTMRPLQGNNVTRPPALRLERSRWSGSPDRNRLLPHRHDRLRRVSEIFVDRGDDLRAVADRGGDTLDRAGADVADGEHAAAAGLQRQALVAKVLAGEDEAARVELQPRGDEPVGIRFGADKGEQVAYRPPSLGAGFAVAPGDRLKVTSGAFQ